MKVITISMSSKCLKTPPCSFCFQKDQEVQDDKYQWNTVAKVEKLVDEGKWRKDEVTFCWEYNGYNLSMVENSWHYTFRGHGGRPDPGTHFTMTTYPDVVTPIFAGYLKSMGIEAVALSYDSAKVKYLDEYTRKVKILKEAGLKVSCNQLLEKIQGISTPKEIVELVDQVNLLSMKPTGKLNSIELTLVRLHIESLKRFVPVTLDNCLGVQLGYTDKCHRGEDFLHILSDGTIVDCCFREKCFLYKGGVQ